MSYGKVKETFWTSKTVLSFTDDAKLLALYFLSGPHRNIIGCMRVPNGYILEDLRWSADRVAAALKVLIDKKWLCRDGDGWTLVCNQLEHDPIKHTNHVTAAVALANQIPHDSPIYIPFAEKFAAHLDGIGMGSRWDRHPTVTPLPSPEPEPLPEPEPEEGNAPADADAAPLQAAVDTWNALADEIGLAKVQVLNATRRRSLRQRLVECGGIDGWAAALAKIRGSPFCRGDNERGWQADFDFLLKPARFTKLMEGGYDGSRTGTGGRKQSAHQTIFAAAADVARNDHG